MKMLQLKINKLFLTCILTFSGLNFAAPSESTHHIDQHNWDKFSDTFIKSSQLKTNTAENKAIKLFSSLALGTAFWLNLSFYFGALQIRNFLISEPTIANPIGGDIIPLNKYKLFSNKRGLFLTTLPSLYLTRYAYKKMNEWILAREEQKALRSYIENWEVNQKTTPAKLHDLLNNTYLKCKENPAQVDFAETARIVKEFINNQKIKNANARHTKA